MKITKILIPAAGIGSRFLPITKSIPKEMLPLSNKPAIEHIVQEACDAQLLQVGIILSPEKNVIKEYFDLHAFNYVESSGVALDIVDFSATAANPKECPLTVKYQELSGGSYVDISLLSMWQDASQVLGKVGTYKVLYTSNDLSGNPTVVTRKIFVLSDSESPSITLTQNHINVEAGEFCKLATELFSSKGHHPDKFIWKDTRVLVSLTSHSAGGVTDKDWEVASELDRIYTK